MNDELFERLLHEEEGTSVDFKQAQYSLDTEDGKGELVKDILAFANSWRRTDAYILIGVREIKGGRSEVLGGSQHLNDNDIQQLVNSKTQRPVEFACEAFTFEGKPVGVIRIPEQERPFFLTAGFGKLKKGVVYVRRGSSTDEADPDEVAQMGAADRARERETEQPQLEVHFCDPDQHADLGTHVAFDTTVVHVPADSEIPDYGVGGGLAAALSSPLSNREFYRDVAEFARANAMFKPLAFVVSNRASVTADDVRVKVTIPKQAGVTVLTQGRYPRRPDTSALYLGSGLREAMKAASVTVEPYGDHIVITTLLGKIQPKGRAWSAEPVFIGATESQTLTLDTEVSADTLRDPLRTSLEVEFQVANRPMTLDQLFQLANEYRTPRSSRG